MPPTINRRNALEMCATAAGSPIIASCSGQPEPPSPEQRTYSSPGPDPNYVRNLTPGPTPVRLACMTGDTMLNYPETGGITEMVMRIRERGYTAANASYPIGRRNRWLDAPESDIAELKQALAEHDVDFFDTMVWTNLLHPDETTRQKNLKYVSEAVEAADRVGCRMVTLVTGSRSTGMYTQIHPDNWTAETWALSIDSLRQIIRDTAGCKTALGVEACVTTNIDRPEANARIVEDVGDPRCRVCLDPTNMMSLAHYYQSPQLLDRCFDLMGEHILGCHAKDYNLLDRMYVNLVEVPPGKGIQDYETYLVRLSRLSWPRTLMLEHFPAEEYPAAKAFIEQAARNVGVAIYA